MVRTLDTDFNNVWFNGLVNFLSFFWLWHQLSVGRKKSNRYRLCRLKTFSPLQLKSRQDLIFVAFVLSKHKTIFSEGLLLKSIEHVKGKTYIIKYSLRISVQVKLAEKTDFVPGVESQSVRSPTFRYKH